MLDYEQLTDIPAERPTDGRVVVHNHVRPQWPLGRNGFRAWTTTFDADRLVECDCDLAGHAPEWPHYRVRR